MAEKIHRGELTPDAVDENLVAQHLYTTGGHDPDLLIRTSGELRLSNFLLWQMAYAEMYFTATFWPDFDRAAFLQAVRTYQHRDRRFGGADTSAKPALTA